MLHSSTSTNYVSSERQFIEESESFILNIGKSILISRYYEQFSRSSRNLGHFGSWKKFQTLRI